MKNLRETIRAIIQDDALYKRKDLPGDVDDPPEGMHYRDCGCLTCSGGEDFVKPRYALYSMIGDAIHLYDSMDSDDTGDADLDDMIISIANKMRGLKI